MSSSREHEVNFDEVLHFKTLRTKLKSMRDEKCVVMSLSVLMAITVDGKDIHPHKIIICAAFNYFDAMLSRDTLEKQ